MFDGAARRQLPQGRLASALEYRPPRVTGTASTRLTCDHLSVRFGRVDALVNNMQAGATDKVVYEAAATCLPVLASNPALDGFLPEELRFDRDDPASLTRRLEELARADRAAVGRELRARVERDHDVEGWAERVLEVAREKLR